jgi:hypothetical protein
MRSKRMWGSSVGGEVLKRRWGKSWVICTHIPSPSPSCPSSSFFFLFLTCSHWVFSPYLPHFKLRWTQPSHSAAVLFSISFSGTSFGLCQPLSYSTLSFYVSSCLVTGPMLHLWVFFWFLLSHFHLSLFQLDSRATIFVLNTIFLLSFSGFYFYFPSFNLHMSAWHPSPSNTIS